MADVIVLHAMWVDIPLTFHYNSSLFCYWRQAAESKDVTSLILEAGSSKTDRKCPSASACNDNFLLPCQDRFRIWGCVLVKNGPALQDFCHETSP